ncbi:MAG: hypothetical protein H6713_34950 [Myxococcales bacterium]|nr:hypothetical protein [Myxococcales bacterium]MCB9755166.1 hypothetical protein [Myxococcales bacterium]
MAARAPRPRLSFTLVALSCALSVALPVALTGCDTAAKPEPAKAPPDKTAEPTPPTPPTPPPVATREGPGWLDGQVIKDAMERAGVHKVKLDVGEDGALRYIAVYHDDAAAIPEAVVKARPAEFADAEVVTYEREHYADIGPVHEVELKTKDGRECEYSAKPDGALVYTECKLDAKDVPPAVLKGVSDRVGGGEPVVKEAELTTRADGSEEYGIVVDHEGAELKFYVDKDGGVSRALHRIPAVVSVPYKG